MRIGLCGAPPHSTTCSTICGLTSHLEPAMVTARVSRIAFFASSITSVGISSNAVVTTISASLPAGSCSGLIGSNAFIATSADMSEIEPISLCGKHQWVSLLRCADTNHHLAPVLSPEQIDQGLGRILEPLDNIHAGLELTLADPVRQRLLGGLALLVKIHNQKAFHTNALSHQHTWHPARATAPVRLVVLRHRAATGHTAMRVHQAQADF